MDLQNNMAPKLGKLEQIIHQFFLKCLQLILVSRVPSLRQNGEFHGRRSDSWFHLALGDTPSTLDDLNFWHTNLTDPMIIDIILVNKLDGYSVETVMERWVVKHDPHAVGPTTRDVTNSHNRTCQHITLLFRALYTLTRLLPAHNITRKLSSNYDIIYKVSSFGDPFSLAETTLMEECRFAPVIASPGKLCISVTYRTTLSDLNLECSTSLPAKIITDYVGRSPMRTSLRIGPKSKCGLKGITEICSSLPMGKKSKNAAVGVLVHKLRTAPPLRQNLTYYWSHSSNAQLEGGVATASGFTRKTVDASEELRSYREIRDHLISKRGSQILNRDKAPEQR